ncbi:MAG: PqiC family protein [Proteobacteria bacterium]|nr:PqiC family protein [Pseudomonadota bacterium]
MIRILPIIIMISLLLGCSSTSPPPKFYTLSSLVSPKTAEFFPSRSDTLVIGIGPVEIPDYLDKPQIVTRTATNELLISEFNLWGGSLKMDVTRVLIENISSFLGSEPVTIVTWRAHVSGSYRIPIYLFRLDATPDGTILLRAKWGIVAKDGITVESIRESSITKPVKGKEYNDTVNAMSDVLADLSKEIASAIKAVVSKAD